ncbi:hypothetical protein CSUI_003439 [Cystoisospora suis]|uniref:CrcB family protein n=1 Tax=Cystoisospora suis TaxID=483139 RepID=A0A2C6L5G3_9APIC|nr:hypothetical protein CSUI_003439 [Cystoisospora suis]
MTSGEEQGAPSPNEEEEDDPSDGKVYFASLTEPFVPPGQAHHHHHMPDSVLSSVHPLNDKSSPPSPFDIQEPHRSPSASLLRPLSSIQSHQAPELEAVPSSPSPAPLVLDLLFIAIFSALGTLVREGFLYFTKKTPGWGLRPLPLFDALWPNFCGSILSALFLPLPKLLSSESSRPDRKHRRRAARRKRKLRTLLNEGKGGDGFRTEEKKKKRSRTMEETVGGQQRGDIMKIEIEDENTSQDGTFTKNANKNQEERKGNEEKEKAKMDGVSKEAKERQLSPAQPTTYPAFCCLARRSQHSVLSQSVYDLHEDNRTNDMNKKASLLPYSYHDTRKKHRDDDPGSRGHLSSVSSSRSICSFFSASSVQIKEKRKSLVLPPLLASLPTGLSKGFCASLTTFSSWIFALVQAACSNENTSAERRPDTFNRFNQLIWIFLIGLAIPVFGFHLGTDAALLLQKGVLNRRRPKLWTFADVLRQSKELRVAERERGRERNLRNQDDRIEQGKEEREREEKQKGDGLRKNEKDVWERKDEEGQGHEKKIIHPQRKEERRRWRGDIIRKTTGLEGHQTQEDGRGTRREDTSIEQDVGRTDEGVKGLPSSALTSPKKSGSSLHAQRHPPQVEDNKKRENHSQEGQRSEEDSILMKEDMKEGTGGETSESSLRKKNKRRVLTTTEEDRKAILIAAGVAAGVYCLFGCLAVYDKNFSRRVFLWYPPLLSFIGGWIRFSLSRNLDVYTPYFPMGTFLSNVLASCLVAGVEIILKQNFPQCQKHASHPSSSSPHPSGKCEDTGYFITEAVIYGVCSSLSTMSTFISELSILPKRHGYRYALATVVLSFFLALAIYAPLKS